MDFERGAAVSVAPGREPREWISGTVRERLIRDGADVETERLASLGRMRAEKALAASHAAGGSAALDRASGRPGTEKGDRPRVDRVDHEAGIVTLKGNDGLGVARNRRRLVGVDLRAGGRIRWTRNDVRPELVDGATAKVAAAKSAAAAFRLEVGRGVDTREDGPRPRGVDHAFGGASPTRRDRDELVSDGGNAPWLDASTRDHIGVTELKRMKRCARGGIGGRS